MKNETQEITFSTTDHGYETVGAKYHCDLNLQKNGSWNIWRNDKCFTSNTLDGAKAIALGLNTQK